MSKAEERLAELEQLFEDNCFKKMREDRDKLLKVSTWLSQTCLRNASQCTKLVENGEATSDRILDIGKELMDAHVLARKAGIQ